MLDELKTRLLRETSAHQRLLEAIRLLGQPNYTHPNKGKFNKNIVNQLQMLWQQTYDEWCYFFKYTQALTTTLDEIMNLYENENKYDSRQRNFHLCFAVFRSAICTHDIACFTHISKHLIVAENKDLYQQLCREMLSKWSPEKTLEAVQLISTSEREVFLSFLLNHIMLSIKAYWNDLSSSTYPFFFDAPIDTSVVTSVVDSCLALAEHKPTLFTAQMLRVIKHICSTTDTPKKIRNALFILIPDVLLQEVSDASFTLELSTCTGKLQTSCKKIDATDQTFKCSGPTG